MLCIRPILCQAVYFKISTQIVILWAKKNVNMTDILTFLK